MTTTLILALAVATQSGGISKAPKTFTSKEGGFSAAMPGKPKVTTQTIETPVGPVEAHMFVAEGTEAVFVVSYVDYSAEVIARFDARKMLENAQKGSIDNLKGELKEEEEIELDGKPGRAFAFSLPPGQIPDGFAKARFFMVEDRLYQVMVIGKKSKVQEKGTERFFTSFKLLRPK